MKEETRRLYLKAGDQVFHSGFPEWGSGVVMEERNSGVPGGMSYVRIAFSDGMTRVFDNNFAHSCCCYYAGIRICAGERG
jgi:hypothetical protein